MVDALEGLEVNEAAMRENLAKLLKDQPANAFGAAGAMIDSTLAEWATSRGTTP
jgi:hypothetical protein